MEEVRSEVEKMKSTLYPRKKTYVQAPEQRRKSLPVVICSIALDGHRTTVDQNSTLTFT
jgi:hypothetical protein